MIRLLISLLFASPAVAGVIGGTHDSMGPGMGPVVNHALIPAPAKGYSDIRIRPWATAITKQPIGSFRTTCTRSHYSHNDPIVFPGIPGATHLHMFFGNTGTDAFSTVDSIMNSGNSTCNGGIANRSAYWVPALIDAATGAPIDPLDVGMYYKGGGPGIDPTTIVAMPDGLRVLAGNAKNKPPSGGKFRWQCLSHEGVKVTTNTVGSRVPESCPIGSKLQMEVFFPQCWDGKNLDSPDHKSHMAYPNYYTGCPATHPVPIPEITFNVHWVVGPWLSTARLSSDMYDESLPAGHSAHGDLFVGWKRAFSELWNLNCNINGFDCHGDLLGDGTILY